MNEAWSDMIQSCTESGRCEYGFWIYYSFSDGTLHCGPIKRGNIASNSSVATIVLAWEPTLNGAEVCASFHVHTSYQYVNEGMNRYTGPSQIDKEIASNRSLPGLLYDYASTTISSGDSKYNSRELFLYGLERRPSN